MVVALVVVALVLVPLVVNSVKLFTLGPLSVQLLVLTFGMSVLWVIMALSLRSTAISSLQHVDWSFGSSRHSSRPFASVLRRMTSS